MLGNLVKINDSNAMRFYLGEKKMKRLMRFLKKHGYQYGNTEPIQPVKKNGYEPPEGIVIK